MEVEDEAEEKAATLLRPVGGLTSICMD